MPHATLLRLHVLGPVTVRCASDPPASTRVTQPRHLALLCYLVLARPRGLHARDAIIALLWPEHDQARGRQALRNALHGLRQLLGRDVILSIGSGLVGIDPHRLACDALDLERDALQPAGERANGSRQPFDGFHVASAPGFDHWLSGERERLKTLVTVRDRETQRTNADPAEPRDEVASRSFAHAGRDHVAYDLFVRGQFLFLRCAHGGAPEELHRSRVYFERALAVDASYAPAIAGLANFYAVAARREVLKPFHTTFAKAMEHSHRAHALDASLAIPHVHFGVEALYLKDEIDRAGEEFRLAASKEPRYAEARRFFGVWLGLVNRHDDALREMEAAVALEPDIPHMLSSLAAARLRTGDTGGAEQVLRQTLALDPHHAPSRERLLRLFESQERFDEAMTERGRSADQRQMEAFMAAWRADGAAGYRRARHAELSSQIAALEARQFEGGASTVGELFSPPLVRLVALYAQLGEWKKAKAWKLQACAARPALSYWFASLPELQSMPSQS